MFRENFRVIYTNIYNYKQLPDHVPEHQLQLVCLELLCI